MGRAATIGGAEARGGYGSAAQALDSPGPGVLAPLTQDVPDLRRRRLLAEVVNVPMPAAGTGDVAPKPGRQPTRPKGAAKVEVGAGREGESPQPADRDRLAIRQVEQQNITPGLRGDLYRLLNLVDGHELLRNVIILSKIRVAMAPTGDYTAGF
jgi:hypothetical protein